VSFGTVGAKSALFVFAFRLFGANDAFGVATIAGTQRS
jgi:hypothetical protein